LWWAEFPNPGSRDEDYLSYVSSSDALVHVIPIDWLTGSAVPSWPDGNNKPFDIDREIADLRLAAQLARPPGRSGARKLPLLVVVSKMDLVGITEPSVLLKRIAPSDLEKFLYVDLNSFESKGRVSELLGRFQDGVENQFASLTFTFSAVSPGLSGAILREEFSSWMYQASRTDRRTPLIRRILVPSEL
jgi:hypothetical protein